MDTFNPEKLPRGIEKTGNTYRVTVSVGGKPQRRSKVTTIDEALAWRDELDKQAAEMRTSRMHIRKGLKRSIGTLGDVSVGYMLTSNGHATPVARDPNWGIASRLKGSEIQYSARCWVDGKMRWGGMHANIEDARAARDKLKEPS